MFVFTDGKYVVLPSGELQIRNVSAEDGFKTYKCRTKHRLTGETKLSATAGRLVITGKIYRVISLTGWSPYIHLIASGVFPGELKLNNPDFLY